MPPPIDATLPAPAAAASVPAAHVEKPFESRTVTLEHRLDASPQRAWKELGCFCAIARWQSVVARCDVVEHRDGIYRTVVMTDNSAFVERLDEYSASAMAVSYSLVSGPLDVRAYAATFSILPGEDAQHAKLRLQARFTAAIDRAAAIEEGLQQLFRNGLKGIDTLLAAQLHGQNPSAAASTPSQGARP